MTPGLASICWSGPLDGPNLCRECGVAEDWSGGGVEELCSNGYCPDCCEAFACHLECVKCKRRVEAFELCECCGRCDLHDCAKDEALDRWADAKGDEMRDERAVGGAL